MPRSRSLSALLTSVPGMRRARVARSGATRVSLHVDEHYFGAQWRVAVTMVLIQIILEPRMIW